MKPRQYFLEEYTIGIKKITHFIEYNAYEELKIKNEHLKLALDYAIKEIKEMADAIDREFSPNFHTQDLPLANIAKLLKGESI